MGERVIYKIGRAVVVGVREARNAPLSTYLPCSFLSFKRKGANTLSTLPPEFRLPQSDSNICECTFIDPVTLTQLPTSQHGDSGFLSSVL